MAPYAPADSDILSTSSHDVIMEELNKAATAPLDQMDFAVIKRVTFGPMVDVLPVLSRSEYTEQELADTWYDREAMHKMKNAARSEAQLVDSGVLTDAQDDFTTRGLEGRTRKGAKRKRIMRTRAYNAVFFELDCQQEEEYFSEDLLADAYFTHSEPCAVAAHMMAKRDEVAARKIYEEIEGAKIFPTLTRSVAMVNLASSAA